ncbi:unnamed protein product [Boreogadus saida]
MTYAYLFTPSFKVSPNTVDHVASFLPTALCYLPSLAVLLPARAGGCPLLRGVSYRVSLIAVLQMLPAQRQLGYKRIPQGSVAAGPLSGARFKTLRGRKPPRER